MAKRKTPAANQTVPKLADAESAQPHRKNSYFLSLTLENLRCFGPKQTLNLSDAQGRPAPWTIILGVNGTGKTTILQLLARFQQSKKTMKFKYSHITYCRDIDLSRANEKSYPNWIIIISEFLNSRLRITKLATHSIFLKSDDNEIFDVVHTDVFRIKDSNKVPKQVKLDQTIFQFCVGYGANRRLGSSTLAESDPDDATASLFSDRAELRNPEEWLLRLDYAASKKSDVQEANRQRFIQVKELLLKILYEVEDIRLTEAKGTLPTSRVEFKTPYGWVPLRGLGFGYQTLITWVTDLASRMVERYPDSPNPLEEPAVVLVDEIDLHLHPVWQRKLIAYLTDLFPNTQFIATAHSPLVAQAAADANLAVLRREGDHVVIDNDVDNIRGWRIDQILTSDLFGLKTARPPQFEELLLERKTLLTKSALTAADKRRLKELDAALPAGETGHEVKELDEIRKTIELLKQEKSTGA